MKVKIVILFFLGMSFIIDAPLPCLAENDLLFSIRVESLEREKILLDFPAKPGDRFYIHYIHSSDKTSVHDIFEIGVNGEMILIEENFDWYGAGLESMEWEKASINIEDGKIRVYLNRPFPFLRLRVGRIANHTLICNGVSIPLREIARGGEPLKIWVKPRDQP
jgi:hypothetical protein